MIEKAPSASALCESMRSLGYSLGAAVADLIDNSIAADAKNVWLALTETAPEVGRRLYLLDDGHGMTGTKLEDAMRLGSRSPVEPRAAGDLGRFGLGLKTASFSQCRCVTVATRRKGLPTSTLRWDLDHVRKYDRWELLEGPEPGVETDVAALERMNGSGTIVIWSRLDRLASTSAEAMGMLRRHLSLTFHRMIETDSLRIHTTMDGGLDVCSRVPATDPFLRRNTATRPSPQERIDNGCTIRGYVLPHPDRCTTEELEEGELGTTWRDRQGCYVYRNRRLLVAGGWLGLDRRWRKDVETQLARVEIEFDNTWDERWKLDVMKSRASPPEELRERLRELARKQREGSINVFMHRRRPVRSLGGPRDQGEHLPLWISEPSTAGRSFRVSRTHPVIRALCDSSPVAGAALDLIEDGIPEAAIWHEFGRRIGDEGRQGGWIRDTARMKSDLLSYVMHETAQGKTVEDITKVVRAMEPYDEAPEIVDAVFAELGLMKR